MINLTWHQGDCQGKMQGTAEMTVWMTDTFFESTNIGYDTVTEKEKRPFWKRILIIDDDPDVTTTFKVGIENSNNYADDNKTIEVYTYNDPLTALSEFESNFYDLALIDIYLPNMNGFQLCEKILHFDINVRVCFISNGEINREALREIYPAISLGCFMRKPVTIDYLVKRIRSELDQMDGWMDDGGVCDEIRYSNV